MAIVDIFTDAITDSRLAVNSLLRLVFSVQKLAG
jgi:hypothetical protein